MIVRLQHVGMAVGDFPATCRKLERIGLKTRDFRNDQGKGYQHDSRVLLGNDCWVHVVHNWNPASRVARFLARHGQRLEHIALETDDIEEAVARLRSRNVPIFEDTIFHAADGYEAFVYPDDAVGFTVELIQPHATSWSYPEDARGLPVSASLGVVRAGHIRAAVSDLDAASDRFENLFGLPVERRSAEAAFVLGNECSLLLSVDGGSGSPSEGLTEIGLETVSLEQDVRFLRDAGVRVLLEESGQAVIDPDDGAGFSIRLLPSRSSLPFSA